MRWLLVTAAIRGDVHTLKAQFEPFGANETTPYPCWGPGSQKPVKTMIGPIDFAVKPDGKVREYRVDLSHVPVYAGWMMRVKILIPAGSGTVQIKEILAWHQAERKGTHGVAIRLRSPVGKNTKRFFASETGLAMPSGGKPMHE